VAETTQEWRGKIGGMNRDEMEAFLAKGKFMRLACLDEDGGPYVVPCWQDWDGKAFWVVPRERSTWARHMARDGRVSFVIDDEQTLEKVWGKGRAELVEEPNVGGQWVEVANRMAVRYLGPNGPAYLVPTLKQPRWLFRIVPTQLKTWQGVGWARRYWVEETGGPSYEEAHGLS
jgi:nitroimidazol reductase NimA-like FMN-containing flavoprotein (pyridoxamine 5'-phosphate oxidase superfamily)